MKERMWAALHKEMSEYWDERCIDEHQHRIAEEWGAGMPHWVETWSEHLRTLVVDSGALVGLGLGRARVGLTERAAGP